MKPKFSTAWCRICETTFTYNSGKKHYQYNMSECEECIKEAGNGFYAVRVGIPKDEDKVFGGLLRFKTLKVPFKVLWYQNVLVEKYSSEPSKNTLYKLLFKYTTKELLNLKNKDYVSEEEFNNREVISVFIDRSDSGFLEDLNEWHRKENKTKEEKEIIF